MSDRQSCKCVYKYDKNEPTRKIADDLYIKNIKLYCETCDIEYIVEGKEYQLYYEKLTEERFKKKEFYTELKEIFGENGVKDIKKELVNDLPILERMYVVCVELIQKTLKENEEKMDEVEQKAIENYSESYNIENAFCKVRMINRDDLSKKLDDMPTIIMNKIKEKIDLFD